LNGYFHRIERLEDHYGSGVGCDQCRDWPALFVQLFEDTMLAAGMTPEGICPRCGRAATQVIVLFGEDERGPQ
jgi:hypothetical protein